MSGRACPEGLIDSPSGPVRNRLNRRRNQSGRRENSREAGGIHPSQRGWAVVPQRQSAAYPKGK